MMYILVEKRENNTGQYEIKGIVGVFDTEVKVERVKDLVINSNPRNEYEIFERELNRIEATI